MKVDLHTHILPESWPDLEQRYGGPGWVRLEHHQPCQARMLIGDREFRVIDHRCWDAARRLEDCDRDNVGVQVLSTLPVMFSYWSKPEHALDLSMRLNDHIAGAVAEHPARFVGLGTIPMQSADHAVRELERCVAPQGRGGLGFPGVQIGTHVNGRNLDDPALRPIFDAAQSLGAALFVHPWDMLAKERMPKYWLPWLVGMPTETALAICCWMMGGGFERWPRLRVCFAHGGGSFSSLFGRVSHGFAVRPDLCAVDNSTPPAAYLRHGDSPARFWVDSLVHDAHVLRLLIRLVGLSRICLGSDYPFPLGEHRPGELIESMPDLDASARHTLLRSNSEEFLGLSSPTR